MNKILFNNQITARERFIDIEDRGYQFGDGIYEVIGVYDGKPFLLEEHLLRLKRSAKEVHLQLPEKIEKIKGNLEKLVQVNELVEGIIYLQISRGTAARWHEFPSPEVSPVMVAYTRAEQRMSNVEDEGAIATLTEDIRWLRCDIKTLNLLPNVLAKQKAVEQNAIEAILHRGETVTEASASNVFMVRNEEVYTHPANNFILNGITRQQVLQLCNKLGIPVNEKPFNIKEMLQAEEVFITATKLDIVPILKVDQHTIASGNPGNITKKILREFRKLYQKQVKSKS
ncbi:D-amino-acid transaminase [Virgibacillus halodenitrificans]|uniref:D-alanine aminotransferase n=1 Tax=Virgibacillus halodenitrificans TaxID=1482 RepID=A0AAC9NM28_VIRHA|nr:D-amino-acid transaminase [Virgibacillus halodenitrificans]APC49256.1 D-amino-acid transaminase [Virgibacillus halodenitrificans]MCG1026718.1 D-amino-acid transaminase [Virgibacillus halodenitrificans]MCJ0930122.1 D-amino-acid transaminase [Virgibacillus halodenitrificans]CDQ30964.1 D-alanine aminotransferase [Virgibacillus halodenitrificans]